MKAGIVYADHVTTVSPTYASEIQTGYYGYGLDGLLSAQGSRLSGIVNGIDTKSYNPATDPHIAMKYRSGLNKKTQNKIALQEELNLPVAPHIPLMSMVTRLVDSKGLDLVIRILDERYYDEIQFVVLGTGTLLMNIGSGKRRIGIPIKCRPRFALMNRYPGASTLARPVPDAFQI